MSKEFADAELEEIKRRKLQKLIERMNMPTVKEISENDFEREVLGYKGLVIVDFYAEWCTPCKIMGMIINDIRNKLPRGVKICKINIDMATKLARSLNIFSIPTLIFFCRGREVERIVGLISKEELLRKVERISANC